MSTKNDKSSKSVREANAGSWILDYDHNRSKRLSDFSYFKDDCEMTHETKVGPEPGGVLRTGKCVQLTVPPQPIVPIEADYYITPDSSTTPAEQKSGKNSTPPTSAPTVDERAYKTAVMVHELEKAEWQTASKNQVTHKSKCESQYLPAIFAWLLSRLSHDLKTRVQQETTFDALNDAYPKDPCQLLALISTVMSRGTMDDDASDNFELIRDLFAPEASMKDNQSLVDYSKAIKDKKLHIQSKPAWTYESLDVVSGTVTTCHAFDEEFFVLLMFHGLSKQYTEAKTQYLNDVAAGAINRYKTFDGLINHFSKMRSATTGDIVSATTLTAVKSQKSSNSKQKSKNKDKKSAGGNKTKFDAKKGRPCAHCNGAHWDSDCTSEAAKTARKASAAMKDAKSNARPSTDGPTKDEIAKAILFLREKESRKAETLATAAIAQNVSGDELKYLLEMHAAEK
jgi:hypothetical protein